MREWYDDEALWEDLAPVLFSEEHWTRAGAEVAGVLGLTEVEPGAAVLDLGCGPGRHGLELARRGYRVTGVDRKAKFLDQARERTQKEGLQIEWVEADMREFRREGAFDAAVNLFTSFGYFADPADDRRVAENLLASLKPDGRLVMDLMGKEVLARLFQPRDWHERPDGTLVLEERRPEPDWSWINVRWILIRGQQRREHRLGHRLYSAAELHQLLAGVGFTNISTYGSLQAAPYDHLAQRLVMVAQRPWK